MKKIIRIYSFRCIFSYYSYFYEIIKLFFVTRNIVFLKSVTIMKLLDN